MKIPKHPMTEQCAARGVAVPVGATAGTLRQDGYTIDAEVPDRAVIEVDATSPTGHRFTWRALPWRLECSTIPEWCLAV